MRLKRFSTGFFICFSLIIFSLLFIMTASFSAQIKIEDVKKLGLPVLYIETENGKKIKSKTEYRKASWSLESPDGYMLSGKCKIRGRGNTTWETRELYKKPYLLKLNNAESLLGMPKAEKWVLMANTADKTSLRNFYAEYLAKKVFTNQPWIPSSKFIILYINGRFEGLYGLTEKVEMLENRIKPSSGQSDNSSEKSFLVEIRSQLDKDWNFITSHKIPFSIRKEIEIAAENIRKGKIESCYSEQTEKIYKDYQNTIQAIEDIIFSDYFSDSEKGWQKYLDKDSFVDWYLINEFTKNHDAAYKSSSFMFYDGNAEKIFMGPTWDFDISCGNISWDDCEIPEGEYINSKGWYQRLFEDENFKKAVHNRFLEKSKQLEKSFTWLQSQANQLTPAIKINDSVWKNIGHRQWPHAPGWKNRKTYQAEVDYMIDFLKKRRIWLEKEYSADSEVQKQNLIKGN